MGKSDEAQLNEKLLSTRTSEEVVCHYKKSNRSSRCNGCCCLKSVAVFGSVVFAILALVIYSTDYIEEGINGVILDQIPLKEGSERTQLWKEGVPPLIYRIYLFNLTNPKEFLEGGRPRLQEVGPFVYDVVESKEEVVFNGSTVMFRPKPLFVFREDLSPKGGETLVINTLNIPLVNAGISVPITPLKILRETLVFDSIKTLTVKELLWGHSSKVLNFAKKIKDIPYPFDYFALLAGRNNTLQPLLGINTGIEDIYKMGQVIYSGGPGPKTGCNSVFGTDGSAFGPNVNTTSLLYIYNGQFCRSLPLVYKENVTLNGIKAFRFVLPNDVFTYSAVRYGSDNPDSLPKYPFYGNSRHSHLGEMAILYQEEQKKSSKSQTGDLSGPSNEDSGLNSLPEEPVSWKDAYGGDNKCFCYEGRCPPDGILDMRACLFGASVGFSFPHLMNADPSLRHVVRGMRPDPKKHGTEFDIFPDLGIPVRVKLRMQMNVVLDRNQALNRARHFDLIYPIFWFEAGIDGLPESLNSKLLMAQDVPPLVKNLFLVVCGGFSVILLIAVMGHTVMTWCSSGLSSLRSYGTRDSDSPRSNTPDVEEEEVIGFKASNSGRDSTEVPMNGDYRSFVAPQLNTHHGNLIDNHTLLPPYKSLKKEQRNLNNSLRTDALDSAITADEPQSLKVNSKSGVITSNAANPINEPDESRNEYPPAYNSATSPDTQRRNSGDLSVYSKNSDSSVVSAEVHHCASVTNTPNTSSVISATLEQDSNKDGFRIRPSAPSYSNYPHSISRKASPALHRPTGTRNVVSPHSEDDQFHQQMEHKSIPKTTTPKIISETMKTRPAPGFALEVAPLASPEDDHLPATPSSEPEDLGHKSPPGPLATSSPHVTEEDILLPETQQTLASRTEHPRVSPNQNVSGNQHPSLASSKSAPPQSSHSNLKQAQLSHSTHQPNPHSEATSTQPPHSQEDAIPSPRVDIQQTCTSGNVSTEDAPGGNKRNEQNRSYTLPTERSSVPFRLSTSLPRHYTTPPLESDL